MRTGYLVGLLLLVSGCTKTIHSREELSEAQYKAVLTNIAPYVIKKPDAFTYEQRFETSSKPFYQNFIELTKAEILYYQEKDSAHFFFFNHRDLTSMKERYRGLGGYFKVDADDSIVFVNLLYHTPRFTKEEMDQKGKILFESMTKKGNVDRYLGNKNYVETPNADFYYNTQTNRWDYTENSSWKFLDEAKERAQKRDSVNFK